MLSLTLDTGKSQKNKAFDDESTLTTVTANSLEALMAWLLEKAARSFRLSPLA
jgi:hypothetical protein